MAKGGYTPINNVMFDDLCKMELTAHEFRILLFIIRNTICHKRKSWRLAVSFISKGTGISERQVKRVLKSLCSKNLIEIQENAIGSRAQKIKILGDISGHSWGHSVSSLGDMGVTDKGDMGVTQEIKENNNKEIKEKKENSDQTSTDWDTYFDS